MSAVKTLLVPGHSVRWLVGAMTLGLVLPAAIAVAVALLAYYPIGSWLPSFIFFSLTGVMLMIVGAAGALLVVAVIYSLVSRSWRPATLAVIAIACMALGFVPGIYSYRYLKLFGYELLGARSAALIGAIEAYERSVGAPPRTLADIVPDHLPAVPNTGMAAYPAYEYAPEAGPCPDDNKWHLQVDAGEVLKWDFFFYCPHQSYTVDGWGGVNIVMGDWAYLDE